MMFQPTAPISGNLIRAFGGDDQFDDFVVKAGLIYAKFTVDTKNSIENKAFRSSIRASFIPLVELFILYPLSTPEWDELFSLLVGEIRVRVASGAHF